MIPARERRRYPRHERHWRLGQVGRSLVEDLRFWDSEYAIPLGLLHAAARRIEELEAVIASDRPTLANENVRLARRVEELEGMMDQKPSVGRVVHYTYGVGGQCCAAIVTRVWSDTCVNLVVFDTPEGACAVQASVEEQSDPLQDHRWHWPERV